MSSDALKGLIISKLQARGFDTQNEHATVSILAQAIAQAVVEHIQANAQVQVSGGSSAGTYQVS